MSVWKLIKECIRDIEYANNIKFGDQSWQRLKELDTAIEHHIYENYEKPNMPMDDGDGLLTCSVCRDRYTQNADGICGHCKQQAWLDAHG